MIPTTLKDKIASNNHEYIIAENDTNPYGLSNHGWVFWKLQTKNGKPTKVPYQINGNKAKANDSNTWNIYSKLSKACTDSIYDGIGYMFNKKEIFLDFDDVLDPNTGNLLIWAENLLDLLQPTYVEISPSGTGLHVFMKGSLPDGHKTRITMDDGSKLEVFTHTRFSTVTTKPFRNSPLKVNPISEKNRLYLLELLENGTNNSYTENYKTQKCALSTDEVISELKSKNQWIKKFNEDDDESAVEWKLFNNIYDITGPDPELIKNVYISSPLRRDKTEERINYHISRLLSSRVVDETLFDSLTVYDEFKNSHSIVTHGGKILFIERYKDDSGYEKYSFSNKNTKKDEWADRTYHDKNVVDIALKGYDSLKPMRRYRSVVFKPKQNTEIALNLWNGFPVKPKQGDITPFMEFIKHSTHGDDLAVDRILDWFADMYQNPNRKVQYCIVLKGDKGAGKNTIERMLGEYLLYNQNYFRSSVKEQIFGKFNAHLLTNLLLVGQEVVWGGTHDYDSQLKELITEPTRAVEQKGIDVFQTDNYSRVLLTSNAEWVVPASGKNERRFYILMLKRNNNIDFTLLWNWYNFQGGKEALMYEMLHRDLSQFDHTKAPHNDNLNEQLTYSLRGIELFCHIFIEDGSLSDITVKNNKVGATVMYNAYQNKNPKDKITQTQFGKTIKKLLGITDTARPDGSATNYILPSRFEVAKSFESQTGIKIPINENANWDTQEDESSDIDDL